MPVRDNTILVITNIPTPYRIPLFNELDRLLDENGMELKLVFAALGYSRRKWRIDMGECRFDYEVLRSRAFRFKGSEDISFSYPGIFALLRRERPLLTFVAGYSPVAVKLWLRNLFVPTPYVIWSGAVANLACPDPGWKVILRRLLVHSAVGCVAYGSKSKSYLESLGASADKISIAINTVDTGFYRTRASEMRVFQNRPEPKILLYVGDLVPRKRVDLAIQAVKQLSALTKDFVFVLVGDGPERENLQTLAERLGVEKLLRFEGFKEKSELPAFLAAAECLLFPTGFDIWGLVLVEAMAAGLACISSVRAGAADDLIDDGVTGFTVDFEDSRAVADKISWVLDNPEKACAMGDAASNFIAENASLRHSAEGFLQAIELARPSLRNRVGPK